jgi:nuclear transport factor 2 (NTF2) superfamily protein
LFSLDTDRLKSTMTTDTQATERPPYPPFDEESAWKKVLGAEAAWNTQDPEKVSLAYTTDSVWRNRGTFLEGRAAIVEFLTQKWAQETKYALRKDLWAYAGNRIAVRFQYESRDLDGQWWRSYGNENWEFAENGLMRRREASINDISITEDERRIFGSRPDGDRSSIPVQ